jgi:hypothetical protein
MAWKFPQEYVRDGDVIEPSDWRINLNEMLSEINGYLDRDNIRQKTLNASAFQRETFTSIRSNDDSSMLSFLFNMEQSGWIKNSIIIDDTQFLNTSQPDIVANNPYYVRPDVKPMTDYAEKQLPHVTLFPNTSGLLIAEFSGVVDWVGRSSNRNQLSQTSKGDYAGISEKYSYFAPQDKKYKQLSAFIQCSMWRLTVDGQTIAETGPIGNEYQSHPIYLCGATPVSNTSRAVVQLEVRFVWYSPGTNSFKSASGYLPFAEGQSATFAARSDCVLSCPNLIATFRKR